MANTASISNHNNKNNSSDLLNIGIVGLGAIGTLFAEQLQAQAKIVHLTKQVNNESNEQQTHRILIKKNSDQVNINIPQMNKDSGPLDLLLVTTKSFQTLAALEQCYRYLKADGQIVLLQNGYGQQQAVCDNYPQFDIFVASTTEGAYRQDADTVVHAGLGQTYWGAINAQQALKLKLESLTGQHLYTDNIKQILIDKLAINCVINPLTAFHNCLNGELANDKSLASELIALAKEVESFLQSHDLPLSFSLIDKSLQVAKDTASNRSSMLQDVSARRATEIDYICGYLLALCKDDQEIQLLLPITEKLNRIIKSFDKGDV